MSIVSSRGRSLWPAKVAVLAAVVFGMSLGGCKTQDDANAAAAQMSETAETLSAYYRALGKVVAATQDTYQAQAVLQKLPPQDLAETLVQIRLRSQMAGEVSELAQAFQQLSKSSAASDASTAAGNLNTELVTVNAISSNTAETKAVTEGIKLIVSLLQQHDERKAALQIAPLSHNLSVFFDSERGLYDSIDQAYLLSAESVAKDMVRKNQVDVSPVFASALRPFNLEPKLDQGVVAGGMQPYLLQQIDDRYKVRLGDGKRATSAMSAALKEMDERIARVAANKPMLRRVPPLTLATAKAWVHDVEN
jgi:hypothetical protein